MTRQGSGKCVTLAMAFTAAASIAMTESGWAAGITAEGSPRMLLSPWSVPEDDREDGIFFTAR